MKTVLVAAVIAGVFHTLSAQTPGAGSPRPDAVNHKDSSQVAVTNTSPKDSYIWLNVGYNKSFSAGLGFRYTYIGLGLGSIGGSDDIPAHMDYSIPHGDYTVKTFKRATWGLDLYGFLPISNVFSLYASGGYYSRNDSLLARSNVTNTYYAHGTRNVDSGFAYGAGLHVAPYDWILFGAGWHNYLGTSFLFGYIFQ